MAYFCKAEKNEELKNLFDLFDLKSDSIVDKEEMMSVLKSFPKITHFLTETVMLKNNQAKEGKLLHLLHQNNFQEEIDYLSKI